MKNTSPKCIKAIESKIESKLKLVRRPKSEIFEIKQLYLDDILEVYREAFKNLIECTVTCSPTLNKIKNAYEDAINIRDERISQFIVQDPAFFQHVDCGPGGPLKTIPIV